MIKSVDYDEILANGLECASSYGMDIWFYDELYYVLGFGRILGDFFTFELALDYIYLMR